jgi:hypothetical protein
LTSKVDASTGWPPGDLLFEVYTHGGNNPVAKEDLGLSRLWKIYWIYCHRVELNDVPGMLRNLLFDRSNVASSILIHSFFSKFTLNLSYNRKRGEASRDRSTFRADLLGGARFAPPRYLVVAYLAAIEGKVPSQYE